LRLKNSQIVIKYPSTNNYAWIITVQKKFVEAKGLYTEITVKEKTGKKISVHCLHNGDTVHTGY
jgi:hypothetical protein